MRLKFVANTVLRKIKNMNENRILNTYRKIGIKKNQQSKTRAGAIAGVGLALDPEGKKSVLIQTSSFELRKYTYNAHNSGLSAYEGVLR